MHVATRLTIYCLLFTEKTPEKCKTCRYPNDVAQCLELFIQSHEKFVHKFTKIFGEFQIMFTLSKFVQNFNNVLVFNFHLHKYKKFQGNKKTIFNFVFCFFCFFNSKHVSVSQKNLCPKFCFLFLKNAHVLTFRPILKDTNIFLKFLSIFLK